MEKAKMTITVEDDTSEGIQRALSLIRDLFVARGHFAGRIDGNKITITHGDRAAGQSYERKDNDHT